MWADTCVLLAMAYDRRQLGSRQINAKKAIKEYESALKIFSSAYPELWAMINHALGTTYSLREDGKRLENIRRAMQHYREALEISTPYKDPERYSDIQSALRELNQEERALEGAKKSAKAAS